MTAERIDVLERAGARRLVLAFGLLAAVLVPLAALGAANDWWFLRFGSAPVPTTAPQVVQEGEWDGHPWRLVAFPSATHGLCVSFTPKGSADDGKGGAMGCSSFVGVPRTPEPKPAPELAITFLAGDATEQLPAYIAGAVVEGASVVEVRFPDGDVLRAPTVAGPEPLEHIRFYAAQLPAGFRLTPRTPPESIPAGSPGSTRAARSSPARRRAPQRAASRPCRTARERPEEPEHRGVYRQRSCSSSEGEVPWRLRPVRICIDLKRPSSVGWERRPRTSSPRGS